MDAGISKEAARARLTVFSMEVLHLGRRATTMGAAMEPPCPNRDDGFLLTNVSDPSGGPEQDVLSHNEGVMPIPRAAKMLIAVLAAASVAAGGALGDDANPDAVRGAVERGEIKPLAEIIATLRDKLPGEIVGTEIERKKGRWLYEF